MVEKKMDIELNIRTNGIREWGKGSSGYNRYEATPYSALEIFFSSYRLEKTDRVVDFGCGRGRVTFYLHNKFKVPVTGVEANDKTFTEVLKNKETYRRKRAHIAAPIQLEFALAEQYDVHPEDNHFYFFNPFSLKIFKQVVMNIKKSLKKHQRPAELILYYPLPEFKRFLQMHTNFELVRKMKIQGDHGKYGKFVVFRYPHKVVEHDDIGNFVASTK